MARILLIDDDDLLREILAKALTQAGHVVIEAREGREGVELFRAAPVDLVLTDIIMPDREGLETIIALRRELPRLPIIAMSGGNNNSPFYLKLAAQLGAQRRLAKPFTPALLLRTIENVLAETRADRPTP